MDEGEHRSSPTSGPLTTRRFVGIDGAGKHGWVGIVIDERGFVGARLGGLSELIGWAEPVGAIGIDIPIRSMPGGRCADGEARRFVGPGRQSSVFPGPPAEAFAFESYPDVNAAMVALGVKKLSKQSWALMTKMREAADVATGDDRVHEIHPEVSFRELAGEHLRWSKKSWNGLLMRRRLLAHAGIELPEVIEDLDGVVADDVVDAAAAAWSARRIATGAARSLPDPPEESDGRPVAIWY